MIYVNVYDKAGNHQTDVTFSADVTVKHANKTNNTRC